MRRFRFYIFLFMAIILYLGFPFLLSVADSGKNKCATKGCLAGLSKKVCPDPTNRCFCSGDWNDYYLSWGVPCGGSTPCECGYKNCDCGLFCSLATTPCTSAQECRLLSRKQLEELVEPLPEKSRDDLWDKPGYMNYKKGINAARLGNFEDALTYLKKQVQKTKTDQRLEDEKHFSYFDLFPRREMGMIYFREKDFKNALRYLEKSVVGQNTAKGRFYLDRTRSAYIRTKNLDYSPPVLDVKTDIKDKDGVTKEFWARITASVEDDSFIGRLTINQKEIPTPLSSRKVIFKKKVPLLKHQNDFFLKAEDVSGKIAEKKIRIYNDSDAPLISFAQPRSTPFSNFTRITLSGEINDTILVSEFSLGGETIRLGKRASDKPGPEGLRFSKDYFVFGDSREFELAVKDRLGNLVKGNFTIRISASGQARLLSPSREVRVASLIRNWLDFLLCSFLNVDSALAAVRSSANAGPKITITNLEDEQKVHLDKIFIEGNAWDPHGIRTLTIKGEHQPIASGVQVFFGTWIPLDVGENRIIIRAENQERASSEKVLRIIRKERVFRKIDNRMTLNIMPFVTRGEPTHRSDLFMELVMAYFVSHGRFRIVEREQLSLILQEQKLVLSDLIEKKNAIRVGKLLSADAILTGVIHESPDSFEVVSWLVDVETSEIMESKEEYAEEFSVRTIRRMAQSLVQKYRQAFPLVEGVVLNRDEQTVYEDMGTRMGVKTGRKFIVFRDKGPIVVPKTGLILGRKFKLLGEVRISEVFRESSRSEIVQEIKPHLIDTNDRMIAK